MASFEKRGKTWRYVISHTVNGKREKIRPPKGVTYRTKKEAQDAAAEVERNLGIGVNIKVREMLLSDYFERWMKTFKLNKRAKSTEQNYLTTLNIIEEYMPGITLGELNRMKYQAFINTYSKEKTQETVRKVHTQIRACIRHAINEGELIRDPTFQVELGGKPGKPEEEKFHSLEQSNKLVKALLQDLRPDYTGRFMILTALFTGVRYGECQGLTVSDVLLEKAEAMVNKSWDYKYANDFTKTKTELSERIVPLPPELVKLLKWYKREKQKRSFKAGIRNNKDLFFTNNQFRPLNIAGVNKALEAACYRAGVPRITYHGLRHTYASLLLYQGKDLLYVSKLLGHSGTDVTEKVYAHVVKEVRERNHADIANTLDSLYTWGQFGDGMGT